MEISRFISKEQQQRIADSSSVDVQYNGQGLCLIVKNKHATCTVSLFGAHVLSFIPMHDGIDRLWLSDEAVFDGQSPIRGGIPICWPWFSTHHTNLNFPSHGFVRNQYWQLDDIIETKEGSTILSLTPQTCDLYDYFNLSCQLHITIDKNLQVSLTSINNSQQNMALSQALHTYLKVPDINRVSLVGMHENYYDKTNNSNGNSCPQEYKIASEVDRIHEFEHGNYQNQQSLTVVGQDGNEVVEVLQMGHDSTVIWNPWQKKSQSMQDMTNKGYQSMICIEAANTDKANPPLLLKAGEKHTLTQVIK